VNTKPETAVGDYLDQLRRELADLPAAEVEEIVQDLEPQLAATAEELGAELSEATLAERLGTPAEYAAELRAAMGLPGPPPDWRPPTLLPRAALSVLVLSTLAAVCAGYASYRSAWTELQFAFPLFGFVLIVAWLVPGRDRTTANEALALPEVRRVTAAATRTDRLRRVVAYLVTLRPGWFLARAALVGVGIMWTLRGYGLGGLWPEFFGAGSAVLAIPAGYRALTDRRWLWLSIPMSGLAVGLAVRLLGLLPDVLDRGM
jgi:hypothetical protein